MKILVLLAHFSLKDGPIQPSLIENSTVDDPNATLSDHILVAVLNLLKKEVIKLLFVSCSESFENNNQTSTL